MKYFTIAELTKSATADRLKIDNTPTPAIEQNLKYLVFAILDPIREEYGKPIYVNCAYRCPKLNKAVGGSKTSAHLNGLAADLHVKGESNYIIYEIAKRLNLQWDQIILERGTIRNPQWVHIGISRTNNRRQVLYFDGKRYVHLNK